MVKSSVVIKEIPDRFVTSDAWSFLEEVKPVLKRRRPTVVFDFSRVSAMDRSGILVLVKCFEEALKQNGDVKLASVPAEVASTFQQMGLDEICDIYDTAEEASESFHEDAWAEELCVVRPVPDAIHSNGD